MFQRICLFGLVCIKKEHDVKLVEWSMVMLCFRFHLKYLLSPFCCLGIIVTFRRGLVTFHFYTYDFIFRQIKFNVPN